MTTDEVRSAFLGRIMAVVPEPSEAVLTVYEQAKEYYGEDRVDLQPVFWPQSVHKALDGPWRRLVNDLGLTARFRGASSGNDGERAYEWLQRATVFEKFSAVFTEEVLKQSHLPAYAILVKFEDITVSNERDESTTIEEIFAMTHLSYSGHCVDRMFWSRTKASALHYLSGWRHSHLHTTSNAGNNYSEWRTPCLGTGPITMTINSLESEYNLDLWALYWLELDQCIRVESIEGGPYARISSIRERSLVYETHETYINEIQGSMIYPEKITQLVKRVAASGKVKWAWRVNKFVITTPFVEFVSIVSDCYLDMLRESVPSDEAARGLMNTQLHNNELLWAHVNERDQLEILRASHIFADSSNDRPLPWRFKGEQMKFEVINSAEVQISRICIVPRRVYSTIYQLLNILANTYYGRIQRIRHPHNLLPSQIGIN